MSANVQQFRLLGKSSEQIRKIASEASSEYTLIYTKESDYSFVYIGLERMVQVAVDTDAVLVYSDRFDEGVPSPVIDFQEGSVRDDFDFGGVMLFRTDCLKTAASEIGEWKYAALYDLWLRVSRIGRVVHINESLYYETEADKRDSGVKLFDYVNPRNREVQIEMEKVCTEHLKSIGAWLEPSFKEVNLSEGDFPVEASVIIPCKNRVRTIADAIRSALSQECPFPFNVFVIDDNSTDGTVDIIKSFLDDSRLIYIAQDSTWHGIGGNWNAAIHHPQCGRFALQLDSDDVYSGTDTIRRFVEAFHSQNCAMVVGTYRITDINLNELPPGIIDHREWTEDNGRNNALRVNGLGAPRGFWTPLLRTINFPTTKYGEDYAVALRISREYKIGRVYDVMYNCRRWDENSDASLSVEKVNSNNLYKDRLRTWEIQARKALNNKKQWVER